MLAQKTRARCLARLASSFQDNGSLQRASLKKRRGASAPQRRCPIRRAHKSAEQLSQAAETVLQPHHGVDVWSVHSICEFLPILERYKSPQSRRCSQSESRLQLAKTTNQLSLPAQ